MGQAQSDSSRENQIIRKSADVDSQPSSMEDLIAEAVAFGGNQDESLDVRAQKALECPCVANLRSGPCGTQFSEAFLCFLKSTAEEKGSDCVNPFVALQNCIKVNPDAFSKDVLDGEESKKEEEVVQEFKILPPSWSKESKTKL
ncbi:mitochondrial intermembrane space import and assembly protein 40 homolog [Magnolia sinica]|uniref:mitochondrial intermembrane space import and assembly protein 40 homolog n=1 Tax=Magnolia sinica TaxID=86752 RepID=UPI0026584FAF|nr:mitochondrial intermembrane space import and assembly protein 40 homolog [Magnolia sinica]